ncbi:hypothetical protein [Salininema proteolyticum]|uniref:DNA-binding transcriptional regulator of glucitol operon n=1 Tax=Salininema proteolyticum TaxID=1607685 RepID=A0ABV8TVA7_9ACTN
MKTARESRPQGWRRLFTPAWIFLHVLAAILIPFFFGMGYWQLSRAQGGNALSWGYALEWPVFALFTLFLWIRQMRIELNQGEPGGKKKRTEKDEPPPMRSPWETDILVRREEEGRALG